MPNDEYATQEEVKYAIKAFTDADHQKLMLIAGFWHRARFPLSERIISPSDILGEAIKRSLDGTRKWRKGTVSILRHLDRVMESVSGHILEKRIVEHRGKEELKHTQQGKCQPNLEAQLVARNLLQVLGSRFDGDEMALSILRLRALGKTPEEVCAELQITGTDYDTVRKRILEKFVQYAKMVKGDEDE